MDKRKIQDFTRDYIDSFNAFLKPGIRNILKHLKPTEFELGTGERVKIVVENIIVQKPKCSIDNTRTLYPWECRRMNLTYEGKVIMTLALTINNSTLHTITETIGTIPIMIQSNLCHLQGLSDINLKKHNEEDDEVGGYFIVKGNQVMLRYLVQTRRNFPIVQYKPHQKVGTDRTGHQVYIRCVREDETTSEMKIFWRANACPDLQLQIGKKYFQIPLPIILKALQNVSYFNMFQDFPKSKDDFSIVEALTMMFNRFSMEEKQFTTNISCLEYLGSKFREFLRMPPWLTNVEAGRRFIDEYIAINVKDYKEKYDLILIMVLKLHSFVNDKCCQESTDTLNFQEILTAGSLYQQVFRLTLINYLNKVDMFVKIFMTKKSNKSLKDIITSLFKETKRILNPVHYLLSTGSLGQQIVPGVKQNNGLRIMTDNINFYRFIANFRAFHRGAFFTDMKSSTIRRLLPESWGFVCPVHTPDGTPCGLLNHFSVNTMVQSTAASLAEEENLEQFLRQNVMGSDKIKHLPDKSQCICVMLNGKQLGYIFDQNAQNLADHIRYKKVFPDSTFPIPSTTEIVCKNISITSAQFPGIFIFTNSGRLLRPVYNIMFERPVIEYIGTFEQTYLEISCRGGNVEDGGDVDESVTHQELSAESMFSFTGGFTPYQNYNPSPRNLYQCQMSKQSMGFTYYSTRYRSDNKLYCFLTPQIPLTRSKTYDEYDMKKRPLGYNPIVAMCSYTAYDMEDAMVINLNSLERGMGRCAIYKHYVIDLTPERGRLDESVIGCGGKLYDDLDTDGLPHIGSELIPGKSNIYAQYCEQTDQVKLTKYKESQKGYVINACFNGSYRCATICIKLERNTDIGDKFSSRHGQKGVNSLKLPMVDFPMSEDGIVPDQLFNPHSIPSRMTVGMMIEFIAGKLAALSSKPIDSTAFQSSDIVEKYMEGLKSFHYDGFGYERFYDGYRGRFIDAEITMGIVYYQRLRHLVEDKFQVRTIGKIDNITRQPVKGRKIGGGIRLGEMERDGLLSHGATLCLQDRIIDCNSDKVVVRYCTNCKSFIHSYYRPVQDHVLWYNPGDNFRKANVWRCKLCENDPNANNDINKEMLRVRVPAVTRHLFHELTVMNVRVNLGVVPLDDESILSD